MAYQSRVRSPGSSGRGRGVPRRKKAKARAKRQKHRSSGSHIWDENRVPTSEEVVDRTLNRLRNLGSQRFAVSPFSEYFGRWLGNLRDVLSEFESSQTISADDQFLKERSQILSDVELPFEEIRRNEASREEAVKSLSDNRILLERIEEENASRTREMERLKDGEIKRLSSNIDGLREEVNRIARMKTGIFRGISEKARAQKEAEATERLNSGERELALAVQHFAAEQERVREEYERRKRPVIEQIQDLQKEIEKQEIDGSVEARRAACEALVNAVNALLQRKEFSLQQTP
jgi:hypothetical protein